MNSLDDSTEYDDGSMSAAEAEQISADEYDQWEAERAINNLRFKPGYGMTAQRLDEYAASLDMNEQLFGKAAA